MVSIPRSNSRSSKLRLSVEGGTLDARLHEPPSARALYVMAHGAGAGMDHPFLDSMSARLAARGVATLRFQFPYMQAGSKRPDPPRVLLAAVRAALDAAGAAMPGVPLVAGGKSMGGRMTSQLMAADAHPAVRGLVFLGFPLHPAGKLGRARGDHLASVQAPMLFLQGTRDTLADLDLVRAVLAGLGERATLHVVEGGDHSFDVLKRSGRDREQVHDELADTIAAWLDRRVLGAAGP
ncbi:MAG TPA: alpha/beta family hydrolase [Haliangium sp.]|nr:alpha/beta family hydrolase [Haliangium sp.]